MMLHLQDDLVRQDDKMLTGEAFSTIRNLGHDGELLVAIRLSMFFQRSSIHAASRFI